MEQISNQNNNSIELNSFKDDLDLSDHSFSSESISQSEENNPPLDTTEVSRERLNDFLTTLYQDPFITLDEVSRLMEAYFQQLQDETEIGMALFQLGGPRYYRPNIPRDVSVKLLDRFLKMDNENIVSAALDAAYRLSCVDEYSVDVLRLSKHTDPGVRKMALSAMGTGSIPEFHEVLVNALRYEESELMWMASSSLIRFPDKEATIRSLQPLLDHDKNELREATVLVLGYLAFMHDVPHLRQALQKDLVLRLFDKDESVIKRTVWSISQYADPSQGITPELVKGLAAHMHSATGEDKLTGTQALIRCGAKEYASLLNSMLLDPEHDETFKLGMLYAIRVEDRALFTPALKLLAQDVHSSERLIRSMRLFFS